MVIAVGTGEALALGSHGDADVVLVHSPPAESLFLVAGHGTERREVMYNDFVLVGPSSDPAGIRGLEIRSALSRLAGTGVTFISRGDDSGTHKRELSLLSRVGLQPEGPWYQSAGQGMGAVLRLADERRAYTLTDRGTFLFLRDQLDLEILVEGGQELRNTYGVIPISDGPHLAGANLFVEWLTSTEGQGLIGIYGVAPLFTPSAD